MIGVVLSVPGGTTVPVTGRSGVMGVGSVRVAAAPVAMAAPATAAPVFVRSVDSVCGASFEAIAVRAAAASMVAVVMIRSRSVFSRSAFSRSIILTAARSALSLTSIGGVTSTGCFCGSAILDFTGTWKDPLRYKVVEDSVALGARRLRK